MHHPWDKPLIKSLNKQHFSILILIILYSKRAKFSIEWYNDTT